MLTEQSPGGASPSQEQGADRDLSPVSGYGGQVKFKAPRKAQGARGPFIFLDSSWVCGF